MKACQFLLLPLLLLLGGCVEPIPFDHPDYPGNRGNSSLRYPPNYRGQSSSYPDRANERSPWDRSPSARDPSDSRYGNDPRSRNNLLPREDDPPRVEPDPPEPEDNPLVEIDPIEEAAKPQFPYAIPVQDAENLVVSPYAKSGPYINVTGLSSGTKIECPKTKKTILVP